MSNDNNNYDVHKMKRKKEKKKYQKKREFHKMTRKKRDNDQIAYLFMVEKRFMQRQQFD